MHIAAAVAHNEDMVSNNLFYHKGSDNSQNLFEKLW